MGKRDEELTYIFDNLLPEFKSRFLAWNAEYPEVRELGIRAEFHGLHKKVSKLKPILWDGTNVAMREDPRTILLEIVGHALLAIVDWDAEYGPDLSGTPVGSRKIVGKRHPFVGYGALCTGILGDGAGPMCAQPKGASIHEPIRLPMDDGTEGGF